MTLQCTLYTLEEVLVMLHYSSNDRSKFHADHMIASLCAHRGEECCSQLCILLSAPISTAIVLHSNKLQGLQYVLWLGKAQLALSCKCWITYLLLLHRRGWILPAHYCHPHSSHFISGYLSRMSASTKEGCLLYCSFFHG